MTFGAVLRAQLLLLLQSRRPSFLVAQFVGIWVFLSVMFALADVAGTWTMDYLMGPFGPALCSVVALMWGTLVWRDEGPRRRAYHWSLPVDTSMHDAARAVAGGLWIVAGVTVFLLVGLILSLLHGLSIAPLALVTPFAWLSYYTAALLAYGIGAAIATAYDRPMELLVGSVILFVLFVIANESYLYDTYGDNIPELGIPTAVSDAAAIGTLNMYHMTRSLEPWAFATVAWCLVLVVVMTHAVFRNRGRVRA